MVLERDMQLCFSDFYFDENLILIMPENEAMYKIRVEKAVCAKVKRRGVKVVK